MGSDSRSKPSTRTLRGFWAEPGKMYFWMKGIGGVGPGDAAEGVEEAEGAGGHEAFEGGEQLGVFTVE
jgi:hypothetical protein